MVEGVRLGMLLSEAFFLKLELLIQSLAIELGHRRPSFIICSK